VRQAAALVSCGFRIALLYVEDCAAGHVVVDHAVRKAVEFVALAHELAADRVDLGRRHPIGQRLLLNADQFRRKHQRGEAEDRDLGGDAVVVGGVALRHSQSFAAALRGAEEIVVPRVLAVGALDQNHGGVVRLLELHVAEIGDGLVIDGPLVGGRIGGAKTGCAGHAHPPAAHSEAAHLVARIATVGGETLRKQRRPAATDAAGQHRNRAVHAAPAQLRPSA